MKRLNRGILNLVAMALLLGGCQTTPDPQGPAHSPLTDADLASITPRQSTPSATGQPLTVEQALGSDPCSIRLGDIEGALVLYYAVNRELPGQLQDLRSENGDPLQLRCPVSTRPYQYSAKGLSSPGRSMRILVWDDTPIHGGYRWCVFMSPSKPGELALDVKPIPEVMFATYHADLR